ncbi:MAG: DUF3443 domain-containing protein [Aquabacterium sp.]|uniref:DUF3443 domain-containing protein n=1 Tax=Aquabacterium sp. TaxID=1872578 RepID=UPI001B6F4019|nr:DUF3443 domain-containing protein [Aquabacterium sp.]MBP7133211.1 DUF3443 domain-containing protein [Aquabacterium sp.]MBP9063394.1 DUF3443 domain-containing protein [Aquabacterium sp.]
MTHLLPRCIERALIVALVAVLTACGGGGSSDGDTSPSVVSPTVEGANAQSLYVGAGPAGLTDRIVNLPYTRVRVCLPGTNTCQTIDHVLVDTGSTGLRLLASAVSLPLPGSSVAGKPLYNCVQFIDQSYMWGTVNRADVHMGGPQLDGETAANLPIQLVGTSGAPAAPSTCAPLDFMPNDTVNALGANGILGVGPARHDCGTGCHSSDDNGYYYVDNGSGSIAGTAVSLSDQLQQPVSLFAIHNNGVVISLPAVPSTGAASATGALIFGIGTQANNTPGTVDVLTPNPNGYFSTTFRGRTLTKGFVDSGSNGWFFGVTTDPDYTLCPSAPQWYCPSGTVSLQAINSSIYSAPSTVNFAITHAQTLFNNASNYALSHLAGPIEDEEAFDFGLPFFYGRQVYTAINDADTPLGSGPYVAY